LGNGTAALRAALAARQQGARVTMLEAASEEESGGNSAFAGGVMRFAFDGVADLERVTELFGPAGPAQPRHDGVAARAGRALGAEFRPPVRARQRQAAILRAPADR